MLRILASTVLSRYPNASIQVSPFGYVHKHTRTARPRLKRFIQFLTFTPTFVQDLGFILPGFRIRSCPLDLLRLFYVRFTAIFYCRITGAFLFPNLKAVPEGRGFKPNFSVRRYRTYFPNVELIIP
jgi:hypothetical protein